MSGNSFKKIKIYSYDENACLVEAVSYLSPPFEEITKKYGKWDAHGCWKLSKYKDIYAILQGFQEGIFDTIEANRVVTDKQWDTALAFHKVLMTAFLNNESVYLEFTE